MRGIRPASATLFVLASFVLALAPCARAQSVADFYRGKQISWILSADAGGGYSSYALAFAPYLTAHLPGNPKVIVQNMPGAGGIRAMLYLHSRAPRDGTTLLWSIPACRLRRSTVFQRRSSIPAS
jgi:tripartite-type tricarboxylate transporter receptor subunit TctC